MNTRQDQATETGASGEGNDRGTAIFSGRVPTLDVLRGVAALLVFTYHYFVLCPFPIESSNPELRRIITNYFAMGVPLFYALSGVSLYIGFFDKRHSPEFLSDFYRRRFFRIAPLFYSAAVVWVIIFLSRGVSIDIPLLLGTASFVFNLIPGWHESYVAAGWSIGVEMLFYALFPVVIVFAHDLRSAVLGCATAVAVSIFGYSALAKLFPNQNYPSLALVSHLGFFATGILVYFLCRNVKSDQRTRLGFSLGTAGVLLLLIGSLYLLTGGLWKIPALVPSQSVARMLWCIPIGLLVLLACRFPANERHIKPLILLGHWSYSLYLLHPIILHLVFEPIRNGPPITTATPGRFAVTFLVSGAILVVASYLSFRFIEQPFIRMARKHSLVPR